VTEKKKGNHGGQRLSLKKREKKNRLGSLGKRVVTSDLEEEGGEVLTRGRA